VSGHSQAGKTHLRLHKNCHQPIENVHEVGTEKDPQMSRNHPLAGIDRQISGAKHHRSKGYLAIHVHFTFAAAIASALAAP